MLTAVVGARGGVGASTLALALAGRAGGVVVDLDGLAGGLDARFGAEEEPGVRWSGLHLAGGALGEAELLAALPRVRGVPVLAADGAGHPSAAALAQVLEVLVGRVVVADLPRRLDAPGTAVLRSALAVLVVAPASVAGVVAVHALRAGVRAAGSEPERLGLVVVGRELRAPALAAATGLPVLASARDVGGLARVGGALAEGLLGHHGARSVGGPVATVGADARGERAA